MKRIISMALLLALTAGTSATSLNSPAAELPQSESAPAAATASYNISYDGYTLEQVVVLSRHNIRSPLSGGDSLLGKITPHEWFEWSSAPSELSLRGGVLETEMGQYFRKWLESEELIPENYHPENGAVRIYANSKQRTIATAQYFTSGMFPTAGLEVEHHVEFDKMDPVFNPQLTFSTDEYEQDAIAQIYECYEKDMTDLADNYELLSDVIDLEDSAAWQNGEVTAFTPNDAVFSIKEGAEPSVSGSLKTACSVSDALVLQYYEEKDPMKAGFGNKLSLEEWKKISEIKDVYGDVLFTAPMVADNVAYPLINELYSEMETDGRVFSFLCGHDSNVGSVLAALGVSDYALPDAVEKKTPIGCKLVFSRWSKNGEDFWSVDLVYQSPEQLREMPLLNINNSPSIYHLSFDGISQNADGLLFDEDLKKLFIDSMDSYESLYQEYVEKAA